MNGFNSDEARKWLEAEVALKTVELMEKNQELETALKKLELLDKTKNEFLRIISHEIRTPLNGIKGTVYLLKDMVILQEQEGLLEMLETSVERLDHFAFTALQIAQLQATGRSLAKQSYLLQELLNEVKSFLDPAKKKLKIDINVPPGETILPVNKPLFITGLIKIFENAIHFSPEGGTVSLKATQEEEGLHFLITDEGPGFGPDVLLHKFELFVTDNQHVDQNPGMSLYLVKFIVEAHGGKIDLYNRQPKGAVIDFYMP